MDTTAAKTSLRKIAVDEEVSHRERFLSLFNNQGDTLLEDIKQAILDASPDQQQTVFEIIGSHNQWILHEMHNKEEFTLDLRMLRVEVVYRLWRYLETIGPLRHPDLIVRLPSLSSAF